MTSSPNILAVTSNDAAIQDMLAEVDMERSDIANGLKSRWQVINNAIMRYWRFRMIYTVAGASGSGKSIFLNQLRYDFCDVEPTIVDIRNISTSTIDFVLENGEFIYEGGKLVRPPLNDGLDFTTVNLHFGFEMHPMYEILRTMSSLTGYSYQYLLSSKGTVNNDNSITDFKYNKISDDEMLMISRIGHEMKKKLKGTLIFKVPGTRDDMYATVEHAYNKYVQRDPKVRLIVTMDHSLLMKIKDEAGDLDLQNQTIKTLMNIRDDFNSLVVPIIQTNSNMEDGRRRENNAAHYPVKSDLYMGGQFFQGSDYVAVMLQPLSLGIGEYGPRRLKTKNLIHWSLIKSRYNIPGQIWLWNDLERGKIQSCKIPKDSNEPEPMSNLANQKR